MDDAHAGTRLPADLGAALDALEADAWLTERLGPELVSTFLAMKRFEVERFGEAVGELDPEVVTAWEVEEMQPTYDSPRDEALYSSGRAGHARCCILGRPDMSSCRGFLRPCIARTHRAPTTKRHPAMSLDVPERVVRVELEGEARWGRLVGASVVLEDGRELDEAEALYLAPAEPTKILAVHLTYRSRVEEYAARTPPEPSYFVKPPTTLNGHRRSIRMARGARFLNYEGELAVVVGQRMKGVPLDAVLDHVAGYTCANDVGMHDFRHADRGSMLRVKGQDGFLPLGPELVPAGSSTRPTSRSVPI